MYVQTGQWRVIPGIEHPDGHYEVTPGTDNQPWGQARLVTSGGVRLLPAHLSVRGRPRVRLGSSRQPVGLHKLILLAFVGPCPPGMEACHGDDVKTNNRLTNLRWDTRRANVADRYRNNGHQPRGSGTVTPNRSAGRIEDELWLPFLAWCKLQGLSNTDGMRRALRVVMGMPEPVALSDTGSAGDRVTSS